MRQSRTSGSVGARGGNTPGHPAAAAAKQGAVRVPWLPRWLAKWAAGFVLALAIAELAYVPFAWGQASQMARNSPAFPVSAGQLVVVEKGGALGVIRLTGDFSTPRYDAWYWRDSAVAGGSPPERTTSGMLTETARGPVATGPNTQISVGPWELEWSFGSSSFSWVYRPDASYRVRVVSADMWEQFCGATAAGGSSDLPGT